MSEKKKIIRAPYLITNAPIGSGHSTYSEQGVINYTKLIKKQPYGTR